MAYKKTNWQDTLRDSQGNLIQKGTPLNAQALGKIEDGIVQAEQKIDTEIQQVTTQLAQTAKKGEISVADIDKNKGKFDQTYLTEELLQQMAGTTPVNAIPSDGSITSKKLARKAVTRTRMSFIKNISKNLFDKNEMNKTGYYNSSNGTFLTSPTYWSSDFIEVLPSTNYIASGPSHTAYWDANMNYISGETTALKTTPSNAVYMTVMVTNTLIDTFMVAKGTVMPTYEAPKYKDENLVATDETARQGIVALETSLAEKRDKSEQLSVEDLDFLVKVPTVNLFDKEKARIGGYYNESGAWLGNPNYATSDFIPVATNTQYTTQAGGYVVFWDANKSFVSSLGGGGTKTVPDNPNIKFATFPVTAANINTTMIVEGGVLPSDYIEPYKHAFSSEIVAPNQQTASKLNLLKWVAGGDSITAWNPTLNYVAQINASHGTRGLHYALGGRSIASRPTMDADFPPMVTAYTAFPKDADIITIWCGTNDFGSQVPLGTIDSTDITTFYGALNVMTQGLITQHLGKKIAFLTPMQRNAPGDSTKAIPLTDYVQAIKNIGSKYSIPVFDMYSNAGLYPKIPIVNETYFKNFGNPADGLHPNPEGHKIFAPKIAAFLESL